ncbi:MAG: NUDIX domain-containing protein [Actinomycetes bacterium]
MGAILLRGDRLLLIQRANEPARGRWSLPGGRVEIGEDDASAVVREVSEETGLRVHVEKLAGSVRLPLQSGDQYVINDYFVTDVDQTFPPAVAGTDAAAAGWFSRDEIATLPTSYFLFATLDEWNVWPDQPRNL